MPLITLGLDSAVLRCVNHGSLSHADTKHLVKGTTMRAEDGYYALIKVEIVSGSQAVAPHWLPPSPPFSPQAQLNFNKGQTVRFFSCSVCGYVELYNAATVEPGIWKAGG
jgi:hypothetical protein